MERFWSSDDHCIQRLLGEHFIVVTVKLGTKLLRRAKQPESNGAPLHIPRRISDRRKLDPGMLRCNPAQQLPHPPISNHAKPLH
jgi:hypothetical protein